VHKLRDTSCKLPVALGRDSRDELASDLAARTIAHASLITLGVSHGAGGRVVSPLIALRSALLPVSGAVSLYLRNRLGVAVAFIGAALYLNVRIAGTTPTKPVDAGDLAPFELLLALVALLVIVGVVALPVVRAVLRQDWRRWLWALIALGMVAVSGVGAGVLAVTAGPLTWAHLIVAPGVSPPLWATALPILLGTGAALMGPRPLRRAAGELGEAAWHGTWSLLLVAVAAALIGYFCWDPMTTALRDGAWWQAAAVWLWVASVPLALVAIAFVPRFLRQRGRSSSA